MRALVVLKKNLEYFNWITYNFQYHYLPWHQWMWYPYKKKSTLYKHLHTHAKTKHFSFPKTSYFCRSFVVEDNHRQAISSFQHSEYHTANQNVERPDLDEKTGLCQEESPWQVPQILSFHVQVYSKIILALILPSFERCERQEVYL